MALTHRMIALVAALTAVHHVWAPALVGQTGGSPTTVREGDPADRAAWLRAVEGDAPSPGYRLQLWESARLGAPAIRQVPLNRPGAPNVFTPLGPSGFLASSYYWWSLPQADGGRVASIAAHPTDENRVWVGTANGGIWRTTDGGISWEVTSDDLCGLTIGALVVNPARPTTVYAASGEPMETSAQSCGLFRSSDGGTSWTNLGGAVLASRGVYAIHLVASSASLTDAAAVLLVATSSGMLRSTDGGGNWSTVVTGTFTDVIGHPTNASIAWGWKASSSNGGLWRSTDSGATWTQVATLNSGVRGELAVSSAATNSVWVLYGTSTGEFGGVYRYDNSTAIGTSLPATGVKSSNPRGNFGRQAWYDLAIAVDPVDANRIILGGVRAFRSTDGGLTFTDMALNIHADWHALVIHPRNPRRVYGGNDGGIFVSGDGGATFMSRNAGIAATMWYPGIAVHPTLPGAVLGGMQDNGSAYSGGRTLFEGLTGGDGGYTAFHPSNPNVMWTECQWGGLRGCLWKNTVNTTTGQISVDGTPGQNLANAFGASDTSRTQFIPPMVVRARAASASGYRLFTASYRLFSTDNEGSLWNTPTGDLTRGSGSITTIAPAPSDPEVVYVGTSDGYVRRSTDGGATFGPSAALDNRYVTDIAVASNDALQAIFSVSTFVTNAQLWATIDGGTTWTNVTGNLPSVPARAVLRVPGSNKTFVGTSTGVFVADLPLTAPLTAPSWTRVPGMPPYAQVTDLVYQASTQTVVAATYGRGLWALLNSSSAPTGLRGDVNRDGVVTAADALLIQRMLVGYPPATGQSNFPQGDADCDNRITATDVLLTLRFAAGLGTSGACVNSIQ